MTIKKIAERYDIPYNTVYQATYGVESSPYDGRERDYPEGEVVRNLKIQLQKRISKYAMIASDLQEILDRVNKIAE